MGMGRLSLALSPACDSERDEVAATLIECLARIATWDALADFEPEMMGRRSLALP